jgi:predicted AAA+ superfamily ATPase
MVTKFLSRAIAVFIKKSTKSVLLLGPRQVGKSTLINSLKPDLIINLADEMELLTYSMHPDELKKTIELKKPKSILIDEVQRLPKILNSIQSIIDNNKKIKFYLTGSSARKLKRGGANLLPGRVVNYNLGPLTACELDYEMNAKRALSLGTLPEIYTHKNEKEALKILKSYVANYIKEEIKAEALTRNLESFTRFMLECSFNNSQFVDYTKMSNKAKISRHSIPRYFEILEDTLIGFRVLPFEPLELTENLIKHPRFYFFDVGIYNSLVGNFTPSLDRVGVLCEQLVFTQLLHSAWAKDKEIKISSFRTRNGIEVDFIIELENTVIAIEVKHSDNIGTSDCESLVYFQKAFPRCKKLYIFHFGTEEKKMGPIQSLPWQKGLKEIGL